MGQILRKSASLSLVLLLGVLSFGTHASAMTQDSTTHAMSGMSHSMSSSSCATICALATPHKNELIEMDEDDEPTKPFYAQLQTVSLLALQEEHRQQTNRLVEFDPPPGSPAYIRLAVFRA